MLLNMSSSNPPELETVQKCTSHLETALNGPNRDLVHFLRDNGFFTDDVHDTILDPRSLLTAAEKAGEMTKWIKNRVKQDPGSFHGLVQYIRQSGVLYNPIAQKLDTQYRSIQSAAGAVSLSPSYDLWEEQEDVDAGGDQKQLFMMDAQSDFMKGASKYPGAVELVGLRGRGNKVAVPLQSCCVRAVLNGYMVGLVFTLKYINDGASPLKVLFMFPVDQSYAVVGLEATIAGRKIRALLKEKEAAKKEYDDAINSGYTAAYAEERAGDIFSISLGNMPPKAEAEVNLKLVGELPIDAGGAVRFSLPAVLKPRYTPVGSVDPLTPAEPGNHGDAPAVYSFEMMANKQGVSKITSPTHKIAYQQDGDGIKITLAREDARPLEKDLIILIHRSSPHLPSAICEMGNPSLSQNSHMGAPAVMFSFFPKFESDRAVCEFIFLVDRSGSMEGSSINSVSDTLVLFLKSLPRGCTFNIIGFGSTFISLFPNAVPCDEENLDAANSHVESLSADLGCTELLNPLRYIFQQPTSPGLPRQVFLFTDGSVSNTQECINEVARNASNAKVFIFGIGSGVSTALVNGLAKAGNGSAEFVTEGERMQPKVKQSLKRALQLSAANVEVDFQVTSGFEVFQAPAKIPALFKGDKIVVYGIFKRKIASSTPHPITGTATLKGCVSNTPITHSISFEFPPPSSASACTGFEMPVVHHLAAKSLLSDWSNGLGRCFTALHDECKQEMIKLSMESSVISEHTAFVAVDEDQREPITGALQVWNLTATMAQKHRCDTAQGHHPLFRSYGTQQKYYLLIANDIQLKLKERRKVFYHKVPLPLSYNERKVNDITSLVSHQQPGKEHGSQQHQHDGWSSSDSDHTLSQTPARCWPPKKYKFNAMAQRRRSNTTELKPRTMVHSILSSLVSLQHPAGFWPPKAVTGSQIKHLMGLPQGIPAEVLVTILVLVILEERFAGRKDEWKLIAMKAQSWLATQGLSDASLKSLKKMAITGASGQRKKASAGRRKKTSVSVTGRRKKTRLGVARSVTG